MRSPLSVLKDLKIFRPWTDRLQAGITTGYREQGEAASLAFLPHITDDEVIQARQDLCEELKIKAEAFICLNQCHSDKIIPVDKPGVGSFGQESTEEADSLISRTPGLCLSVFSADCVPLLFYDPQSHSAAAVHGGWKGTYSEIAPKTVKAMESRWNSKAEDIQVYIGPAIGGCCYQISGELAESFREKFPQFPNILINKENGFFLNLREIHKKSLMEAGVLEKHIELSEECTLCGEGPYPSYRKSGASAGRFSAFILLK